MFFSFNSSFLFRINAVGLIPLTSVKIVVKVCLDDMPQSLVKVSIV